MRLEFCSNIFSWQREHLILTFTDCETGSLCLSNILHLIHFSPLPKSLQLTRLCFTLQVYIKNTLAITYTLIVIVSTQKIFFEGGLCVSLNGFYLSVGVCCTLTERIGPSSVIKTLCFVYLLSLKCICCLLYTSTELHRHTVIKNKTVLENVLSITNKFLLLLTNCCCFEYKLTVLKVPVRQNNRYK